MVMWCTASESEHKRRITKYCKPCFSSVSKNGLLLALISHLDVPGTNRAQIGSLESYKFCCIIGCVVQELAKMMVASV